MKILVCLKAVPETETAIRIAPDGNAVQVDPRAGLRISRYDELALEQALLIRDSFPGIWIDVISVGPDRTDSILKRALGMGADHGIRIAGNDDACREPGVVAAWIAAAARGGGYGLLLAGVMSEDGLHSQVGPLLAEELSLPCVTAVVRLRILSDLATAAMEQIPSRGLREVQEVRLPAVLTVQDCSQPARYPSLANVLRAKEQDLEVVYPAGTGADKRPRTVRFKYPRKFRAGRLLEGSPQEKAKELLHILEERSLLD